MWIIIWLHRGFQIPPHILFFLNKGVVGCQQPYSLLFCFCCFFKSMSSPLVKKMLVPAFSGRFHQTKKIKNKKKEKRSFCFLCPSPLFFPLTSESFSGRAEAAARRQLDVLHRSAVSRWWSGGILRCFPPQAQTTVRAVGCSSLLVSPLNPCGGRLRLHVHDTWTYRGVFNHSSSGGTLYSGAETGRVHSGGEPVDWGRWESVLGWISLKYFCPLFLFCFFPPPIIALRVRYHW